MGGQVPNHFSPWGHSEGQGGVPPIYRPAPPSIFRALLLEVSSERKGYLKQAKAPSQSPYRFRHTDQPEAGSHESTATCSPATGRDQQGQWIQYRTRSSCEEPSKPQPGGRSREPRGLDSSCKDFRKPGWRRVRDS